jgi:hypothetical protein
VAKLTMLENTIWRNNKIGSYAEVLHIARHEENFDKQVVFKMLSEENLVLVLPEFLFEQKYTQVEK